MVTLNKTVSHYMIDHRDNVFFNCITFYSKGMQLKILISLKAWFTDFTWGGGSTKPSPIQKYSLNKAFF